MLYLNYYNNFNIRQNNNNPQISLNYVSWRFTTLTRKLVGLWMWLRFPFVFGDFVSLCQLNGTCRENLPNYGRRHEDSAREVDSSQYINYNISKCILIVVACTHFIRSCYTYLPSTSFAISCSRSILDVIEQQNLKHKL